MGTISDKLMRIINTKEDIRQALISKGYDVPTSVPFKEYAKMILDLPCKVDSFPDIEGIVARYSASGLTNEQMATNPVWVDKTGNGRDLQLKNFAWGGMSGVGGYVTNKDIYEYDLDRYSYTFIENSTKVHDFYIVFELIGYDENFKDGFNLDVRSISQGLKYRKTYTKNGIYIFQYKDEEGLDDLFAIGYNGNGGARSNFTVKVLPLYPGALVFDGVNDYGVCDNFPILTKEKGYTVVALRQWITRGEGALGLVSNVKNWINNGAFLLEYRNIQADHFNKPISFGAIGSENDLPHIFTYQTSKSYNGVSITTGNFEGTDVLHVGKLAPTNVGTCINAAIWELVFLDHDATEEELTKIKDYFAKTYPWLFPDQAWTVVGKTNEDEDRATIANITGNGNDLVLSNFGFAEGSGYGLYGFKFFSKAGIEYYSGSKISFSKHQLDQITLNPYILIFPGESYPRKKDITAKIKVAGLKEGVSLTWGWAGNTELTITEDGTYSISAGSGKLRQLDVVYAEGFDPDHVVTIEQIPEYEGYLVTDGVDDKAVSKQFKFGENFTVILDFKFPVKKISYCGFDLSSKVRIQNLQGSGVNVVLKGNETLIPSNVVRAVTSEGKVYDENWNEYNIVPGNISSNYTMVNLGFDGSKQFAESATKLAGIYSSALSKDECIKAYNYLQTIKSK